MYRDDEGAGYRAGMNPKFVAIVREKRKLEDAQKRLMEAEERRGAAKKADQSREALIERLNACPSQIKEIISLVAKIHGFTYEDLVGRRRFFALVHARHEAMRKVKEIKPHLSSTQIGQYFYRDHTTVLHAFWKCSGKIPKVGVRVSAWNKEDDNSPNRKRRGVEAL